MQLLKEPQANTKKIPRWLAKFVLYQTQNGRLQQILPELLEPMSPEEWCITWIPILHPGIMFQLLESEALMVI